MSRYPKIILVSSLFVSVSAFAVQALNNDALAAASAAKISLPQAISIAEQHIAGKATRANLEQHKGLLSYDVEVLNDTKIFDVRIDAVKGTIISSNEDKRDEEHEADKED